MAPTIRIIRANALLGENLVGHVSKSQSLIEESVLQVNNVFKDVKSSVENISTIKRHSQTHKKTIYQTTLTDNVALALLYRFLLSFKTFTLDLSLNRVVIPTRT